MRFARVFFLWVRCDGDFGLTLGRDLLTGVAHKVLASHFATPPGREPVALVSLAVLFSVLLEESHTHGVVNSPFSPWDRGDGR